jgi:hypothetical protein
MRLPGFGAQSSLYKTSGYYQMAGSFDHVDGITPQAITCNTSCALVNGQCKRRCTLFIPCPPGHLPNGCPTESIFYEACPATDCPPPPPPCCQAGCVGTCP